MKTKGEIEAAICEAMTRFEQNHMGRGPKGIHTDLIRDMIFVRLIGILTPAEQRLVDSMPLAKGRDLLKDVRRQLLETCRPLMDIMIEEITEIKPISFHHDISTKTGEEIIVFTLESTPVFRELKNEKRK